MLRLKEIRLNKGITQQELALKLGITQQSVARYESETRKLDQDLIIKICLLLDVTPDELLGFKEAYEKYSEYLQSLEEDEEVN